MTDVTAPASWIEIATASHERLLHDLDMLAAADALDVTAPSRLPGWTIGHVITHITHSGDGHLRMLDAGARDEVGVQYPGGRDQRNTEIEEGAVRPAADQLADLRRSCAALADRWSSMPTWEGTGASMGGDVRIVDLPFLRVREVAIHHVDLGIGVEFDDLAPEYSREELRRMEMLWAARQPMGSTALPAAALAIAPATRLAWLMGRTTIDDVAPANIF